MSFKKSVSALVMLVFSVLLLAACGSSKAKDESKPVATVTSNTKVIMLDIGQGDSMLIQSGGKNILVDASKIDTRQQLMAKLSKYNVKSLDLVIGTHAHEDHIGGMDAVLNTIPIKEIYDPGAPSTSKLYYNYLNKIKEKKIKFTIPRPGSKYEIATGVYLEFYTPLPVQGDGGANNTSLVFKLVDPSFSMLFTGDVEKDMESLIVDKYGDKLQSNILKSPHHGSKTSSTPKFLEVVKARDVLISCAQGNDYGHPHQIVVDRYKKANMNMYVTYQKGDITVSGAEKGYKITTER